MFWMSGRCRFACPRLAGGASAPRVRMYISFLQSRGTQQRCEVSSARIAVLYEHDLQREDHPLAGEGCAHLPGSPVHLELSSFRSVSSDIVKASKRAGGRSPPSLTAHPPAVQAVPRITLSMNVSAGCYLLAFQIKFPSGPPCSGGRECDTQMFCSIELHNI